MEKDDTEAVKLILKAATQGYAAAQFNLGICYRDGTGVEKDQAEAVNWYRMAATQGVSLAQSNLGACYDKGTGVEKDQAEAVNWYRMAATQGHGVMSKCTPRQPLRARTAARTRRDYERPVWQAAHTPVRWCLR